MLVACYSCHLSYILESRVRGAAHTYGPMGGSALAQRAEPSCPWLGCQSLQRRDNAEAGHGVQIPPELPGVIPAKSLLIGLECGLDSRQGISSVQSGVHACLLAGAFRGTKPLAHSFPVPFWCGHCWLCHIIFILIHVNPPLPVEICIHLYKFHYFPLTHHEFQLR